MNWLDVIIIASILLSTLLGLKIGLVRAGFMFLAFVLGAFIGAQVAATDFAFLEKLIENSDVRYLVSFTAVFLLAFAGIIIVGGVIYKVLSSTPLKWADNWFGLFLGFLAGIMLAGLVILYLDKYPTSGSKELIEKSFLAPILKSLINQLLKGFSDKEPMFAFGAFMQFVFSVSASALRRSC
jgi:uncharacterized membrane protein required for colicin V production